MDLALLSTESLPFLLRWLHFLAGITWIGLLYYFNFVQVPFLGELKADDDKDKATRSRMVRGLVPRALWWFRWGAMLTFLSGLGIIAWRMGKEGITMDSPWMGIIGIGATLGTLMFLNVWLIIWPKQKIVIASAEAVAGGGQPDPAAADAGNKAFVASRTNTLFSIPMLFFMGAANHLPGLVPSMMSQGLATALILAVEANVLFGKKGVGPSKILDKHGSVAHAGLGFAVVLYLVMELL